MWRTSRVSPPMRSGASSRTAAIASKSRGWIRTAAGLHGLPTAVGSCSRATRCSTSRCSTRSRSARRLRRCSPAQRRRGVRTGVVAGRHDDRVLERRLDLHRCARRQTRADHERSEQFEPGLAASAAGDDALVRPARRSRRVASTSSRPPVASEPCSSTSGPTSNRRRTEARADGARAASASHGPSPRAFGAGSDCPSSGREALTEPGCRGLAGGRRRGLRPAPEHARGGAAAPARHAARALGRASQRALAGAALPGRCWASCERRA